VEVEVIVTPEPDGGVQISLTGDEARLTAAEDEPGGPMAAMLTGCVFAVIKTGNPIGIGGDPRELIRTWRQRGEDAPNDNEPIWDSVDELAHGIAAFLRGMGYDANIIGEGNLPDVAHADDEDPLLMVGMQFIGIREAWDNTDISIEIRVTE
jgi:hypothetical protein